MPQSQNPAQALNSLITEGLSVALSQKRLMIVSSLSSHAPSQQAHQGQILIRKLGPGKTHKGRPCLTTLHVTYVCMEPAGKPPRQPGSGSGLRM